MADEVQIRFGADLGGAIGALNTLKQAIGGVTEPVLRLKTAFANTGAVFRADMQRMVAEHAISLRQALGFDIEYTARRSAEDRTRLEEVLASDAATLAEKSASYGQLVELSARYSAQLAQDETRLAEAARREADTMARPYRHAFDEIGAGWRSAVIGLVEGTLNFQTAGLRVAQSVERGFISMAQTVLSRAAAGPLASLLGLAAPAVGEGVGDVLGNALGGWLGGLLAFSNGGIVPSAAQGWALPNFAGATPALLHSREMVLPAPISEGLQSMIGQGGANGAEGGDMHLHFHGPSDGPAVERWFSGLMARNPGVVRNMLRSNALTPRTI